MRTLALVFCLAISVQGCSYAISPPVARQADKTIAFEKLFADPAPFTGKTVVLGGMIAHTKNTPKGTLIEIVQKELDYWGKPRRTDKTGGRFLLLHPGYLDAMVYAPGREVTVAAEVTGAEEKSLTQAEYRYPLLRAKELRLWEREQQSWDRPQWMDPLHDPYGPGRGDR